MKNLIPLIVTSGLLIGCAPVPMTLERAESQCRDEAGLADGVEGRIGVGVGTGGTTGRAGITVNNRVFSPLTTEEFMAECIERRMDGEPNPAGFGITLGVGG